MAHLQQYHSRSTLALFTAALGGVFSVLGVILLVTDSAKPMGVIFAVFGAFSTIYCLYFWAHPVSWSAEISDATLRWHSPHWPSVTREVPLSEIAAAWINAGEPESIELELALGQQVRLPSTCVPNPQKFLAALQATHPGVKGRPSP